MPERGDLGRFNLKIFLLCHPVMSLIRQKIQRAEKCRRPPLAL